VRSNYQYGEQAGGTTLLVARRRERERRQTGAATLATPPCWVRGKKKLPGSAAWMLPLNSAHRSEAWMPVSRFPNPLPNTSAQRRLSLPSCAHRCATWSSESPICTGFLL